MARFERPRIGEEVVYRQAQGERPPDAPYEERLHPARVLAVPHGEGDYPHVALATEIDGEQRTHLDVCHRSEVGEEFSCWDWPH